VTKHSVHSLMIRIFFGLLVISLLPGLLRAQQNTGSISGAVKDSTGAVLPGAAVRATNVSTGVVDKVVGDASGVYTFLSLPLGTYNLEVEVTGFAPTILAGVTLQVYQGISEGRH